MNVPDNAPDVADVLDAAWEAIQAEARANERDKAPWTPQLAARALVQQAREQDGVE